jgi:hypothetical protein
MSNELTIEYMPDMMERQGHTSADDRSETGISFASRESIRALTRRERWTEISKKFRSHPCNKPKLYKSY